MNSKILLYVAGAYSGNVKENIEKAEAVSINLIRNGFHVITPHKNTAGYEKYEGDGKIKYETWLEMDLNLLSRCDALFVMANSDGSNGVKKEIEFALKRGMPIIYEKDHPSEQFTLFDFAKMHEISLRNFGMPKKSFKDFFVDNE
ncbi:MAG: DUF4406 domain-containing protein [Nanoarchaeota archaeon]|nr:DUF4406 domain-containing protein [Nanoarchaeota archaeon]